MSHQQSRLIDVNDCVLVIIDIQDSFLNKYDRALSRRLVKRGEWIIKVSKALNIPIIAMGEDTDHDPSFNKTIKAVLPEDVIIHNKNTFSMASQLEIFDDFKSKNRNTAVLIGVETDVCVCQSALGLIEAGYNVVTLSDVTGTMQADQEIGINRMRDAGVVISSAKAIYYEWIRSVDNIIKLMESYPSLEAEDLSDDMIL